MADDRAECDGIVAMAIDDGWWPRGGYVDSSERARLFEGIAGDGEVEAREVAVAEAMVGRVAKSFSAVADAVGFADGVVVGGIAVAVVAAAGSAGAAVAGEVAPGRECCCWC